MLLVSSFSTSTDAEAPVERSDDEPVFESAESYRIQRLTWLAVVGILVVDGALPDWLSLHFGLTPLAAALVFILSGVTSRRRGLHMQRSTWFAGALMLATAGLNFISRPDLDLSLVVILGAASIIALGILSRNPQ